MTTTPSLSPALSVELEALAERACVAAGSDLSTMLASLQGLGIEAPPAALLAGWSLLDLDEGLPQAGADVEAVQA